MPKIIGSTLADHRELTRQHLFDALSELMAERPFDSLTMSEIAQRAGVGRTAVYNHFADKESLLLAFMNQTVAQFADLLTDALAGEDDVIERLRIYIRAHLEWTRRYHLPQTMNLRSEMSAQAGSHLRDHAHLVGRVLAGILQEAMDQGRIPSQDTRTLVSLVHGTLTGQRLPEDPRRRERAVLLIQAFVLRGIGAEAAEQPLPVLAPAFPAGASVGSPTGARGSVPGIVPSRAALSI